MNSISGSDLKNWPMCIMWVVCQGWMQYRRRRRGWDTETPLQSAVSSRWPSETHPTQSLTHPTQLLWVHRYWSSWVARVLVGWRRKDFNAIWTMEALSCWGHNQRGGVLNEARLGSSRLDVPIRSPGYHHSWQLCVERFPPSSSAILLLNV